MHEDLRMFDLFSSAVRFDGWEDRFLAFGFDDWPKPKPRTRMLRTWWRNHGPLKL
jgi:hypothetical protein